MFQFKKLDFALIGVQKSGTTTLSNYLNTHPRIQIPEIKELHFFDDESQFVDTPKYDNINKHFKPGFNQKWGDATPIYFYWKPCLERIYNYNKNIKLILVLRNPIDRAFSHWNMETFKKKEYRSFEDCIKDEISQLEKGHKKQHRVRSYVDRGLYFQQLRRLYGIFPTNQLYIINYDNLIIHPNKTLNSICEFLNIHNFYSQLEEKELNKTPYSYQMNLKERQLLKDFYMEDITKLQSLLDWDCQIWLK